MIMSIQKICENVYPVLAYFDTKVYIKAETDTFNVNQRFSANTAKLQYSNFKILLCQLDYGKQLSYLGYVLKKVENCGS